MERKFKVVGESGIPPVTFNDYSLCCPKCGEAELHHDRVDVYTRQGAGGVFGEGEDGPSQCVSVSLHGDVSITQNAAANPSARRHGLRISFWCEQCGTPTAMTIAQHKGATYVAAEEIAPDPADDHCVEQQKIIRGKKV